MSREKDAIYYLPEYMRELVEIQELYKGIQPELELMYNEKDRCMGECFVLTCMDFGLKRWEAMLGLVPLPTDNVEDRRLRVLTALNGDTPYTFERVYSKLKLLCGEANVSMEYAKDIYTLRVLLQLSAKNQLEIVKRMLRRMLPCNIALKCSLAYNTHGLMEAYTHGYLSAYTQRQLREDVL